MPSNSKPRLLLECLEGRTLPATFAVTTPLDLVDPADGQLSLREAISRANNHPGADTIVLPAGVVALTRTGTDNDNTAGDLDVTDNTVFLGAGAGTTIVDARQIDRVFDVLGSSASSIRVNFLGLTIRNGFTDAAGGGIRVGNADLVVRDCAITGNRATASGGGGISNATLPGTGDVKLVRTLVNRNVADGEGGGVHVLGDAQGRGSILTVTGSTIRRNLGGNAGGLRAAELHLTSSIVAGNDTLNSGGGLWADVATITTSTISGNFADNFGGGILVNVATLTGTTVRGNHSVDTGGGIAGENVTLINSTVTGNSAGGEGGGIRASLVKLSGSTVSDNVATAGGGIRAAAITLTSSTASGNHAKDGGGLWGDTVTLINSTVSGNAATLAGGGIRADSVTLLNATVTDNSARQGGGVFLENVSTSNIRNSIIVENLIDLAGPGADVWGAFTSAGHNLIGDGSGSTGFVDGVKGDMVGTTTSPIDPRLGALADHGGPTQTHALRADSPAIDHGDNTLLPPTDQRGSGFSRRKDGNGDGVSVADIGAFER